MTTKAFFLKRLNDHIQYLKKIDAALEGKLAFTGSSHKDCKLGQWIYGEGMTEVNAMNNPQALEIFKSLLEPHEQFHTASQRALDSKHLGDSETTKAAITEMHKLSNVISQKLLALDAIEQRA